MKRIILSSIVALFAMTAVSAQQMPPIPVDPAVRIGHLDNGLTYYVRHNEEPKGQANFYIAQKVGSILEEDNQRGLAHFLEHMCFNGTEKFPGNNIIKYCEKIGVKFGADLNAYTSIDETVYNIDNVPVATVPSAIDSCLWILHDWADGLLLNGDDIDHERGVIHEEWRGSLNATMRQYEIILPALFPGNKYGQRLPIGTMDVVDNFPYKALRDYYQKWYRPDQQGIVVVGDIDVDAVEAKIKDIFGSIAKPENPAERVYTQVEDNEEPIIVVTKDKEQPYAMTYIFCKHDVHAPKDKNDLHYWVYKYSTGMMARMLNDRLNDLAQSANPPFIQGMVEDGDFFLAKTKGSLSGIVVTAEDGIEKGVTTVYREMLRAVRNGFTASEYERARADYMTQMESSYNQREKKMSAAYCSEYVRNFIDNEPIPGIENEFALAQQLVPNIPVEVINQLTAQLVQKGNLAVAMMLPEKDGMSYPDQAAVAKMFADVAAEDIAPYEDKVSDEPLMKELPKAGKVKKTENAAFGYKKYTLSNGAVVYMKATDFNPDQILLSARSWGGTGLYPISDALNLKNASEVYSIGGLGNFSLTDLNKVLAGKKANVYTSISTTGESVSGSTTPKDVETMMQLLYLNFTAMRMDQDAFTSWKTKTKAAMANAEKEPMTALQDTLAASLYVATPLYSRTKASEIDNIDYDRIMKIGNERFANAADFTFIITGAIDEAVMVPLIEQYIGSLPASKKREKANLAVARFNQKSQDIVFDKQMGQPTATVLYVYNGASKYTLKKDLAFDIANQVLSIELLADIREKEGGTYSIQALGSFNDMPEEVKVGQIVYQTGPDKYKELNPKVEAILKNLIENGPSEENVAKAKEYMAKNYKEQLRRNYYYASTLYDYLVTGRDKMTDFEKTLESVTLDDVRDAMAELVAQNHRLMIVMNGVE